MRKTILILGAGIGGVVTSKELSNKLAGNKGTLEGVDIILFEKEEKNIFAPSLLWLMVGKRKPSEIYSNTSNLAAKDVKVVIGEIEKVNPEKVSVTVKGKEYKGDYMVISLGVEQVPEQDLQKYGHDFYTLDGATSFYEQLQHFSGGKIAILAPSLPFKCPAAPYEAAMLVQDFVRKKGLSGKAEVSIFTPEPGPMSVAGKEISEAVKQTVEEKNIKYFHLHQFESANEKTLDFTGGRTYEYDLLAFTPKHQCPAVIKETTLIGKSGWIEVDRSTMETSFLNVYAIGDITSIPLEMGKPLPKAGVFAHKQAEAVAHNIAQRIKGKVPDKKFDGNGQCFLETGGGKAGYAGGNFYGSPLPVIKMKKPSYLWHLTKVLFEKYWFYKYFRKL